MIKNILQKKIILWIFILFVLIVGLSFCVYVDHYFEIKKLINSSIQQAGKANNIFIDHPTIWGAFGDFIGGTFNPVVGILSILLLFATWRTSVETLNQTQIELKESRTIQKEMQKTQLLQQFDSFFFPLLEQLKLQEQLLTLIQQEKVRSELDILYEKIFANVDYQDGLPKDTLERSHLFNTYYFCLVEIIRNIDKNFINDQETANKYINIIKAIMPFKLQQLLSLYLCENSDDLNLFVKYRIFENTPLKIIDTDFLSTVMIAVVQGYNRDIFGRVRHAMGIFGNSKGIRSLKHGSSIFADFLEKPSEMLIDGSGVFDLFVLDFKKLNIVFDIGKHKEFWCIERYHQLLLKIQKRVGVDFDSSTIKFEEEIFFNKINVSYDYFEINIFNEKIIISKNINYSLNEKNIEIVITKEDEEEDIYEASSFEFIKKPR